MKSYAFRQGTTIVVFLGILALLCPNISRAGEEFYQGKTVTVLCTTAPGGTGDLRVRGVVPFLKKHLPGNPTVVVEYVSGGGGRKGANHLYNVVNPDGLTIGAVSGSAVGLAIMGEMGVQYDPDKFVYLGAPQHVNHTVIYTRADLGLDTLEKLRARPGLRIGAQQIGHTSYTGGRLLAYFLDMKDPNFIVGYSSREVDVALLRGELDARSNNPVSALRRNPDWLEKGLMNWHAILEAPLGAKFEPLKDLPEIETFVKNKKEQRLLKLWRTMRGVGSPYMMPPGTPPEIVNMLRATMDKIFADPEFPDYYNKMVAEEVSPLSGKELTAIVADIPREVETLDLLRQFSEGGPLPKR